MKRSEHTSIEATEGDAIASVAHVLDAPETENVAGEGSQVPSALRRSAITGRSKTGGQQELADEIRELAGRLPKAGSGLASVGGTGDPNAGLMSERVCGACRRVRRSRLCHTRGPQARDDWRGSRLTKAHGIWPTRRAVIKGRATITPAGMMFDADAPGRGLISSPFRI